MRIVAGTLGGRTFDSPHGHRTHPMGEKIRGALFNVLGDITGLTVLDAFAGTGAVGFEAISRGAASVVAIENDKKAFQTITSNIKELGLNNKVKVEFSNVSSWLQRNSDARFDIISADPPYNDVKPVVIASLVSVLKPTGTLVVSLPPDVPAIEIPLKLVKSKEYGDARLYFYQF